MREIFRAFVKAGVGSGANLVVGLARNKLIAHYLGPQGMGLVSLLQQFQTTMLPVATLGGDPPLVQGLASRSGGERDAFLASAFLALISSWSLCAIAVALWGDGIGYLLLGKSTSASPQLISLMSIPIAAAAVSSFLMALLTSVGAVGSLQKGQLAGNIGGLIAAIPLGLFWNPENSLLLISFLATTPIVSIACAFWYIKKIPNARSLLHSLKLSAFNLVLLQRFLSFGGVTIVTGFVVTATWLIARREVLQALGPDALGFFSATITLSGIGLSLLSTALSSFYLPRFAAADSSERPHILRSVLFMVMPFATAVLVALQASAHIVVELLFSERFLPMVPLLRWWVAGDSIRAVSYVFGIPIFAAAHLRFLFLSELFFSVLLIVGIHLILSSDGSLVDVGQMYFATYLTHLIAAFVFTKAKGYA